MKTLFWSAMTVVCLVFIGCKGDAGAPGPQGPTGATGQQGPGALANTYFVASSNWQAGSDNIWRVGLTANSITQDVVNNGAVLVYGLVGSSNNWLPLPLSISYDSGLSDYLNTTGFNYGVGTVTVYNLYDGPGLPVNPSNSASFSPGWSRFKVVVIPGAPGARMRDVKNWPYERVAAYYQLKD